MNKLLCVVIWPIFLTTLAASDLTGVWALEFKLDGSSNAYRGECTLEQSGNRLAGSCAQDWEAPVPVSGSVKGTSVTFRFRTGIDAGATATFSGSLDEKETVVEGSWHFVDQSGNEGGGMFEAIKQRAQ